MKPGDDGIMFAVEADKALFFDLPKVNFDLPIMKGHYLNNLGCCKTVVLVLSCGVSK